MVRHSRYGYVALLLAAAVTSVLCAVPSDLDLKLMKQVTKGLGSNEAISPMVMSTLMSQVWLAAGGSTRDEMTPVLGLTEPAPESFLSEYQSLVEYISNSSASGIVTTSVFNRMYLRTDFTLRQTFTDLLETHYGAGVTPFSSPQEASDQINSDVANVTNDRITNLVSPAMFEDLGFLALVSALYFKGDWKQAFEPAGRSSFLTENGEKSVEMMELTGARFPYVDMKSYDVLAIPYADEDYSMLIIRPTERSMSAVAALRDSLDNININELFESMTDLGTMDITMPKFKIESSYSMVDAMKQLGIRKIFDKEGADFRGMLQTPHPPVYVNEIVHKTFIEVNEKGTEAAGAGAAIFFFESLSVSTQFIVDRPFFAVVYNKLHKVNMFTAYVGSP